MNDNKDDEVTRRVVPPPTPDEINSDVLMSYNLGDPELLGRAIDKAINNYEKSLELTNELREIIHVLFSEKYDIFQQKAPTNKWEVKDFIKKLSQEDGFKTLQEYNNFSNRRNEILEQLDNYYSVESDLKEMLIVIKEIDYDPIFLKQAEKLGDFLSDINIVLDNYELFDCESVDYVISLIKENNKKSETIEKLNLFIENSKKTGNDEAENYLFAVECLNDLEGKKQTHVKELKKSQLNELLDFIKNNQDFVPGSVDLNEYEKYNILSNHINLKNDCINCLHNSTNANGDSNKIDKVTLSLTERALKGKKVDFKFLVKLLEKEKVPYISNEKLYQNKKSIEDNLEKLSVSCYAQSKIYKKENSWKNKFKLLVLGASVVSVLSAFNYFNTKTDLVSKTPELIENKTKITKQLYEDKKDAIEKMEKDVLQSISNRKSTIRKHSGMIKEVKDERIHKIKKKGKEWNQKRRKIMEILKN